MMQISWGSQMQMLYDTKGENDPTVIRTWNQSDIRLIRTASDVTLFASKGQLVAMLGISRLKCL